VLKRNTKSQAIIGAVQLKYHASVNKLSARHPKNALLGRYNERENRVTRDEGFVSTIRVQGEPLGILLERCTHFSRIRLPA
jgi:hypothetical protein